MNFTDSQSLKTFITILVYSTVSQKSITERNLEDVFYFVNIKYRKTTTVFTAEYSETWQKYVDTNQD